MKKIVVLSIVVIITLLLISSAKVPEHKEDGYKIKVVADTIDGKGIGEKIIFVSPDGKVIKELKKGLCPDQGEGTIISKDGEYALYSEITSYEKTGEGGHPVGLVSYKISKYNARGEQIFEKEYKVLFEDYKDYNTKVMSEDGSRIFLYYVKYRTEQEKKDTSLNDYGVKKYKSQIEVMDMNGKEIQYKVVPPLGNRQISPDGKIVGGRTYKFVNGERYKHLYFLNTETGEVKICKAEGEVDGKKWSASFDLRKNKEIGLNGGWWNIKSAQSVKTNFDKIPSNLSILFRQEGEQ